MRLLIQRVISASVRVEEEIIASIGQGLLVFVGIHKNDIREMGSYLAEKLINLRIFQDEKDKMNFSLLDVKGDLLVVSQFTLYAETLQGRRPSFFESAQPEKAKNLYDEFLYDLRKRVKDSSIRVETGIFGASMQVNLINDGPVTILIEK